MTTDAPPRDAPEPPPLLETKLASPRDGRQWVVRPRIMRALDDLAAFPLTLVSAPAGFGKTVAVRQWSAAQEDAAVAWVALDAADRDERRFWTYVASSVDRLRPGLGRAALARVRTPGADLGDAVVELVNGITAYRERIVLVLEDLHLAASPAVLERLAYLVDSLPGNASVVATTRTDPDLPLPRLRAQGRLGEMDAERLAFTMGEALGLLVDQGGLHVGSEDVSLLVERTEGWPAGVYLALLWLSGREDPRSAIREFSAEHHHVAGYLEREVVGGLPPEQRDFLMRTSILSRLTPALCDHVLRRDDSDDLLREAALSNLFVVRLDVRGDWFRYHHLFGEVLRNELRAADPGAEAELHRRASAWFLGHGMLEDGVEHALLSGDEELAAGILDDRHRPLMQRGDSTIMLGWVERLPRDALRRHPTLAAAAALTAGVQGRPPVERRRLLAIAEEAREGGAWGPYLETLVSLGRSAWVDGDCATALVQAHRAAEVAMTVGDELVVPSLASLAHACYFSGDPEGARRAALAAIDRPEALERPYGYIGARSVLAMVEADAGRHHVARGHAAEAIAQLRAHGIGRSWIASLGHRAAAVVHAASGGLADAERAAETAVAWDPGEPDVPHVHGLLLLAGIRIRRGRARQAEPLVDRARAEVAGFAAPGILSGLLDEVEAALAAARAEGPSSLREPLSAAEANVLRLMSSELTLREIGNELFVSINTVKTHSREVYRKLGVSSRQEAVARAEALGLLDEERSPG